MIASWRVLRFYDDFSPCPRAQIFNYSFVLSSFFAAFRVPPLFFDPSVFAGASINFIRPARLKLRSVFLCAKTRKIDVRAAIVLLFHLRLLSLFALSSPPASHSRHHHHERDLK